MLRRRINCRVGQGVGKQCICSSILHSVKVTQPVRGGTVAVIHLFDSLYRPSKDLDKSLDRFVPSAFEAGAYCERVLCPTYADIVGSCIHFVEVCLQVVLVFQ